MSFLDIINPSFLRKDVVKMRKDIEYELINTGSEVEPDSTANGWSSWYDHWTYIESGLTIKGWKNLEWSKGKDWFYLPIW